MSKTKSNLVVGLDIGTTKIVALIAEIAEDDEAVILGTGVHPSNGLKRGVVVNIDATVHSIRRAIEEAELMAGVRVSEVVAGISGSHIRSLNSHGIVAIRDKEITQFDLDSVMDAAKAIAIPSDQDILHVLPMNYRIDEQEGVREPLGMSGIRLESSVHIVTGSVCAAQNIIKSIDRCELGVGDIVLEQLASSCVLQEDEKELGVCVIDIGGGTTDIAIFSAGAVKHTAVIPIAGSQVTNDIAVAMRIPYRFAEEVKIKEASLLRDQRHENAEVSFNDADNQERVLSKSMLVDVVHARYEELFSLIKSSLQRSGFVQDIVSGIVLTGGGAKIEGACALAESIFQVPVRVGCPSGIKGHDNIVTNPIYATGVGLVLHAKEQRQQQNQVTLFKGAKGIMKRMAQWFEKNF